MRMDELGARRWRIAHVGGLCALALGAMLFVVLHLLPPTSDISPVRRTISEYAHTDGKWLFDLAVLLIAAGSAATFAEIARRKLSGWITVALGALWTVSLLVIVTFTKTDWSVGPSLGGTIHRYASLIAFLSLPAAVLLAAHVVFPLSLAWRWLARGLGIFSLASFSTIGFAVIYMANGGPPWWEFLPLGLIERLVAGSAVAALAVLLVGSFGPQHPNDPGRVTSTRTTGVTRGSSPFDLERVLHRGWARRWLQGRCAVSVWLPAQATPTASAVSGRDGSANPVRSTAVSLSMRCFTGSMPSFHRFMCNWLVHDRPRRARTGHQHDVRFPRLSQRPADHIPVGSRP